MKQTGMKRNRKNRNAKKQIAMLLVCCMLFTLLPTTALASEPTKVTQLQTQLNFAASNSGVITPGAVGFAKGEGTSTSAYEIATLEQLEAFRDSVNSGYNYENQYIKLTADIDLSSKYGKGGNGADASWKPIGEKEDVQNEGYEGIPFSGNFDGDGHSIKGLYIDILYDTSNGNGVYCGGFFGYTNASAIIQNLTVEGTINMTDHSISTPAQSSGGFKYVGGVVGRNEGGTIQNCHNKAAVTGEGHRVKYAGGVVGYSYGGTVENCYNSGAVTGHGNVGGVVGGSSATVENCYNTGTVTVESLNGIEPDSGIFNNMSNSGGVVGGNSGTVKNCYNTGAVTVTSVQSYVGGVVGDNSGTVENCYNTGAVESTNVFKTNNNNCVGGVVGYSYGKSTVKNSYNTGAVTGTSIGKYTGGLDIENASDIGKAINNVGGVVGYNEVATVENSYNTGKVTGTSSSTATNPETGITITDRTFNNIGGVVGYNLDATVQNSYNIGAVTGTAVKNNIGGVIGTIATGSTAGADPGTATVQNNYYLTGTANTAIAEDKNNSNNNSASSLSKEAFKVASNFTNWNFTNTWEMHTGLGRPILQKSIEKATPIYTAPTAKANLVYDGTEQALIEKGNVTTGGTLWYRLDDKKYSTDIPTGKEATTYFVQYYVQGDAPYYHSTTEQMLEVTIAKADIIVTAKDKSASVGDSIDWSNPVEGTDYTVSGLYGDDTLDGVTITLTCNADMSKAGTYVIEPKVSGENKNYNVEVKNGKLTVSEKANNTPYYSGGGYYEPEQETVWQNPFTDVQESDWFYNAVKYAHQNKLFAGMSTTEFAPNMPMSRGMLVTVLYRMAGSPAVAGAMPFADVNSDAYYRNAILWAVQNNIVSGVADDLFAPDANITREQIAIILYRFAQYCGYDTSVGEDTNILSYDDFADINEYAITAMQYAAGSNVMNGRTESTLNPQDTATRAEVAAILQRFIEGNK